MRHFKNDMNAFYISLKPVKANPKHHLTMIKYKSLMLAVF